MNRDHSMDTLRTISVMLVVLAHCGAEYLQEGIRTSDFGAAFRAGNFANSIGRVSVPLLVMISGRYLLGKQIVAREFYRRRASRIFVPFLFWSLAYSLFVLSGKYARTGIWDFREVLIHLLSGKPFVHLWFLYMIAGLYGVTPLLNHLISKTSRLNLWRLAVVFMVFAIADTLFMSATGTSKPFPL